MAKIWNSRRVLVDGGIGLGKTSLLRRYADTFSESCVSEGISGARIIRQDDHAPILVLPEPAHRWDEECRDFYSANSKEEESSALVDLQLQVISVLLDRELYILSFMVDHPDAVVIQERGFESVKVFMAANRNLFDPDVYSMLSDIVNVFRDSERGTFNCLLSFSEENDDIMVERVEERGDTTISPSYLRLIARKYRDAAELDDAVWDPLNDDVLSNLMAVVDRLSQ